MKKILLFLAILLSFASWNLFAQHPILSVGNIKTGSKTTSSKIIANGELTCGSSGYKVNNYEVSIKSGVEYWGPVFVNGPKLTAKIIDQIKKTRGPGVKVYFDAIHIENKDGLLATYGSFRLTYDE